MEASRYIVAETPANMGAKLDRIITDSIKMIEMKNMDIYRLNGEVATLN